MSGGSFDYFFAKFIEEKLEHLDTLDEMAAFVQSKSEIINREAIASELKNVLDQANEKRAMIKELQIEADQVFSPVIDLMRTIEWFCSNDTDEKPVDDE
jgi:hypothetical protein